jgi:hypothetical protein
MSLPQYILRLPRNYNFITRLPEYFEAKIIKKQNTTDEGSWYLCIVKTHELNILSQIELKEGQTYTIHKRDHMTLELHDKKLNPDHSKTTGDGIDYLR